ncbi:protein kinase [Rubripirellula amarantea]|nr:protein kinase [Rubripirellula amarantea]
MSNETIELAPGVQRSDSQVRLSVIRGPHMGLSWVFDRNTELTIGRGAPSNLVLRSESALSTTHATLKITPPLAVLADADSRNGTFVNGVRLSQATLQDGDRFGVGETEILFEIVSMAAQYPIVAQPDATLANPPPSSKSAISDRAAPLPVDAASIEVTRAGPNASSPDEEDPILDATLASKDANSSSDFSVSANVSANTAQPITGKVFGSYELTRILGSGGMASVYEAKHRRTGETFAIKLIRDDLPQTDKQMQLFVREAGVLTQLDHPRIVKAIEFGVDGRSPYLVMEYLPSIDLLNLVDSQPLEKRIRTACWVISRVLQATHYLHGQGIIHRDIKPANILAYRDRHRLHIKLADFGLAKIFADSGFSGMTNEQSVRGTLAYMSPEQFRNSRDSGPAEDAFACGACLYRLLIGSVPNMIFRPEQTLKTLDTSDVPTNLRVLIAKAIGEKSEGRFQTADELAKALNAAVS